MYYDPCSERNLRRDDPAESAGSRALKCPAEEARRARCCPSVNQLGLMRAPESAMVKLSELATGINIADGGTGYGVEVVMHVYDLDPYTGWANGALMRGLELGVYHVGVEIYGSEWSFQYFDNAWNDNTLTGVSCNTPKQHVGYIYRESLRMGFSPLQRSEICDVIKKMMFDWRANTYHLTHRNCLHFAEALVTKLRLQVEFPAWIKNLCEASKRSRIVDYMVDNVWDLHKQIATWKYNPEQRQRPLSSERHSWLDISRYTKPGALTNAMLSSCSCETQKKKKERTDGMARTPSFGTPSVKNDMENERSEGRVMPPACHAAKIPPSSSSPRALRQFGPGNHQQCKGIDL